MKQLSVFEDETLVFFSLQKKTKNVEHFVDFFQTFHSKSNNEAPHPPPPPMMVEFHFANEN